MTLFSGSGTEELRRRFECEKGKGIHVLYFLHHIKIISILNFVFVLLLLPRPILKVFKGTPVECSFFFEKDLYI